MVDHGSIATPTGSLNKADKSQLMEMQHFLFHLNLLYYQLVEQTIGVVRQLPPMN